MLSSCTVISKVVIVKHLCDDGPGGLREIFKGIGIKKRVILACR